MTVQELIAALSPFDPNWPVIMPSEDDDFCEVSAAFRDLADIRDLEVQLADERDRKRSEVVRLFGPETN